MTSPSSDIIAKRRYHRHRKTKKKKPQSKEILSKVPHPKVSKRLTSGFCFKGAVVTSSHSRNQKDDGVVKRRKSSTDYDLHCLLKAAKSKKVVDESPSTGVSTAEDVDDPLDSYENYPDEDDPPVNFKQRSAPPRVLKEIDLDTGTSSENRRPLGNEEQNFAGTMQVEKIPLGKHNNNLKGSHPVPFAKSHDNDFNNSSENSTTQTKPKPHISSYQKFAVGVVEALVFEKKKLFPNLGLSKEIKMELNNIYHKKKNSAELIRKGPASTCSQVHQDRKLECFKPEMQPVILPTSTSPHNPERLEHKSLLGQKSFKERNVEAWVDAIPQVSVNNWTGLEKYKESNPNWELSSVQFEKDFLESVKNNNNSWEPSKPIASKRWSPPLSEVTSPSFSPLLIKVKKAGSEFVTEPQRDKFNFMKLNFNVPLERVGGYQNPSQKSWTSWFKGNDRSVEQRQVESPICPSPFFKIDPPGHKRSWVAMKENAANNTFLATKHLAKNIEDKQPEWGQFPKLLKKDEKQVSNSKGIHGQKEIIIPYYQNQPKFLECTKPTRNEISVKNERPDNPAYIQFFPRKMF